MSDTQKASNELWHAALKLGLPQLAQLLIPHRPDGWTQTDEKGKAILAKANGGWAWNLAINSGMDPYALTSKGEPFWRTMLPQSSATSPIKGSVRQAVENWVRKEIETPDSSPELMEYVRKNALAIMSVSSGTNAWARLFHSKQVDYVSTLPAQWVNWHKEGIPAWLKMGMHRDATVAKWLDKIDSRPAWLKEIKSDPLSGLAFEILKAHPNQPNNLNHSVNLKDAFSDPRKSHVIEFVKKLLK